MRGESEGCWDRKRANRLRHPRKNGRERGRETPLGKPPSGRETERLALDILKYASKTKDVWT
eukprot:1211896-Pyramimonas_sp.AAC.1